MRENKKIKPFIKWAGGKSQLLPEIEKRLPSFIFDNEKFNYVEPFIGSGAVLFHLLTNYSDNINKIVINDLNTRLIYLYETIINKPIIFIEKINEIKKIHNNLEPIEQKEFYLNRRKEFNRLDVAEKNKIDISVLFLFLNKTGFNGMYRENSKGLYNIPFGKQKSPSFIDEQNILNISNKLKSRLEIRNESYEKILLNNEDLPTFYYLDPPYEPVSNTSNFTQYVNGSDFANSGSLTRLNDYCDKIKENGGYLMLSNSDTEETINSLSVIGNVVRVNARRNINSIGSKRGKINELIIRNFKK